MPDNASTLHRRSRQDRDRSRIAHELVTVAATVRETGHSLSPGRLGVPLYRQLRESHGPTTDSLPKNATATALDLLAIAAAIHPDIPRDIAGVPVTLPFRGTDPAEAAEEAIDALGYLGHELTHQLNVLAFSKPESCGADRIAAMRKQLRLTFATIEAALDLIHPSKTVPPPATEEPEDLAADVHRLLCAAYPSPPLIGFVRTWAREDLAETRAYLREAAMVHTGYGSPESLPPMPPVLANWHAVVYGQPPVAGHMQATCTSYASVGEMVRGTLGDAEYTAWRERQSAFRSLGNPTDIRNVLLVLGYAEPPTIEQIAAWSPEQLVAVDRWADAEIGHANDNPVKRHPKPDVLVRWEIERTLPTPDPVTHTRTYPDGSRIVPGNYDETYWLAAE